MPRLFSEYHHELHVLDSVVLTFFFFAEEYNIDGMSAEVAYFSQDYWMNSLAIGHPLAFQSQASSENKLGDAPELDDASVRNY